MQAILELQRQLKAIQQQQGSSTHKLNERNIVDIIRAVLEQNRVKLIYTSDGKEYLTNEQLEREIKELLNECGGRINILEIPSHLGVNIEIIERSMDQFVKKNKVSLINGQLISNLYVEQVMEELYELVSDQGQVFLQDLTTKYNLPLDFLRESISIKMESSLPAGCQIQGNSIMTKSFAERQTCKIRGILRGVTRPVALTLISQQYKIEEQKLKNVTDQLLKENQIKGKVQQGLFIPSAFTEMQEGAVKNFYSQNKYIEYNMLSKLQVQKPKEFIDQVIGKDKGHHLVNYYVSKELVNQAEAQVNDIVELGTYLDLSMIIPSPFRDSDIQGFCQLIGDQCRLLTNNQHLCSEKFIQKCLALFKQRSEELAAQKLRSGIKPQTEEVKKQPSVTQSTSGKGKAKGKGGGGKKRGKQQDDDFEESKESQQDDQTEGVFQEDEIKQILLSSDIPEFKENKDEAEVLVESLAEFLMPHVNKQFQQIFIEVFARQSTKSQANLNKNLEQEVEDLFQLLQYIQKQMENVKKSITSIENKTVADYDLVISPIKAHLTKNDCQTLLNKLCMVQAFYNNINVNNLAGISKDPKTQQASVQNANDRKLISKQFQKHVTQVFDALNRAVSDKSFDEFMDTLSENIKNLGARIKQVDKKIEKNIKDLIRKQMREQLNEEAILSPLGDFRKLFTSLLNLKLAEVGAYMNLPNEEWSIKIMINLLLNMGIDSSIDEKKKDELIQAQNIYNLYSLASRNGPESSEAQQAKQDLEKHQQLLLEMIK